MRSEAKSFSIQQLRLNGSTIGLLLVLALAGLLRCWGLGAESLWLDEATSLIVAENAPANIIRLTAEDIHPPAYYLLLHFWLVFGRNEAALRSLSVVIGILTVATVYALGRQLWDRRAGLVAALLLAVSSLHVWYSQEARMYGLLTLWALLSSLCMVLAWRRGGWLYWTGYVFTTTLGMYTHYYMGFIVLAQNLFAGYLLWGKMRPPARSPATKQESCPRTQLMTWVIVQLAWIALFAPWAPVVIRQINQGGGRWVSYAVGRPTLRLLWDTFIGFSIGSAQVLLPAWIKRTVYLLYLVVLGFALWPRPAGALCRKSDVAVEKTGDPGRLFCLLLCVVPIGVAWLASQIKPMYSLRYLLPCLPAFCLLVAIGLRRLAGRWPALGLILMSMLVVVNLSGVWELLRAPQKPDWRGLTHQIVAQSRPGDVVLPEPFWNAKPLQYYSAGRLTINDSAPMPATPAGVATSVSAAVVGRQRLWLVEDVGHYGDPERILAGYLNARYPQLELWIVPGIGQVTLYDLGGNP